MRATIVNFTQEIGRVIDARVKTGNNGRTDGVYFYHNNGSVSVDYPHSQLSQRMQIEELDCFLADYNFVYEGKADASFFYHMRKPFPLLDTLIETGLFLTPISVEQLLEREEQEYNPQIWKEAVQRSAALEKIKFYVIEPDAVYSYARFFRSYIADGIHFFGPFSAFSSCLTNNGFCKVCINPEGQVLKVLFRSNSGKVGLASNDNFNRQLFRRNLTPNGVMVSSSI